jgi:uncharacterized protein
MTEALQSCLYTGRVMHHRLAPRRHRFSYSAMTMLFDLDELPELDRRFALFGYNRARPIAFHDADHGPGDGSDLRAWVEGHMAARGIAVPGGAIRILCLPRLFGYAFNPISVWFCFDRQERLAVMLYEVANTFGERRSYLLAVEDGADGILRQSCAKGFHVSPFLPVAGEYRFRLTPPADSVMLQIRHIVAGETRLIALQTGKRAALDDGGMLRVLLRFPLMTAKVITAIHFEALRLWLKRVPFHRHRPAQMPEVMGVEP